MGIRQIQFARKAIRFALTIGSGTSDAGKQASRTNHRREQTSCGNSVAKVEAVDQQPLHSQELSQGTHHVIESLAYQHDFCTSRLQFLEVSHAIGLQVRLQLVLEVLVAEKVEPVTADAPQDAVHHASREDAVRGIKKRTQGGHKEHQSPPHHASAESLRVPRKESYGLNRGQVEQTTLDAPVDRGGWTGLIGMWLQWIQKLK